MSSARPCRPGPGKFEGESALTVLAYWHMVNGNADADIGRYSFFRSPLNFDADDEALTFAQSHGFCAECIADALDDARGLFGVMLWEDDNGFAYLREFSSADDYDATAELAAAEDDEVNS